MKRLSSVLTTVVTVLLVACGGSDGPTDPGGNNGDNGDGDTRQILTNPSFGQNITEIFVRRGCTGGGCHGEATQNNLDLRSNAAFANLVNVAAFGAPGETRVIPGDAENSYVVKKLEGRQTAGARMPLGGTPLDNIDLTNIRNWIDQGAANN